jgi:hypothetical protein
MTVPESSKSLIDWFWNVGYQRQGRYALGTGTWLDNAYRLQSSAKIVSADNPGLIQTFPIAVVDSVPESPLVEGAGIVENSANVDIFELTVHAPIGLCIGQIIPSSDVTSTQTKEHHA